MLASAGLLAFNASVEVLAQPWPTKTVRMIIPFPPGGTLDAVGRLLAQKLSEQTGQQFVVDNRAGGNGIIGADAVAKAAPDGYTVLFNASTFVTTPMTMKSVPYSVERDFIPVVLVAKAPLSVAVAKQLPVTDITSLIRYAREQQGKATFAVGSIASAGHLATERLRRAAGFDLTIVPYKGTAPAMQDLLGGRIDVFIDPVLGSLQHHRSGALRVIAVTAAQRVPTLPEVPTVAETLRGFTAYTWYGIWVPARTPTEVVQRLNAEVNKALSGELRERLAQQGIIPAGGSPEDFARFQREDITQSQKIITEANIRVE
ncbi:MAG: tripartite tricarboxylate transporter substrate binding protein [Casimicrobiaceae bacterium]|nr:tripartite tricarboxylate transporter substrate binding protein [Casimicrobiaceae bacterium]MCX8097798.1 tripartite tricarboxylate transporter substrate binding protein [Casimicrobiaceae bacterium]MDW8312648.1 tripartite tricarboxylate transporter substrate binding protein [Burkholderiales bacterium]